MNAKLLKNKTAIMATAFLLAALMSTKDTKAAAGSPQTCQPSSTCTIGEFLYDDNYNLLDGESCSITIIDSGGTEVVSATSMSQDGNAGWYYYDYTTPATEGYYPTQVCCVVDGQSMCLDKSFEVTSTATATVDENAIATAVWSHSSRTLSSFGTLVTDIWNSSTRTLSSFGSLVSNIWNHSDRNLTTNQLDNGEEIATKGDVANVNNKVEEVNKKVTTNTTNNSLNADLSELEELARANNLMLDELINEPIIEMSLEEGMDLAEKMDKTEQIANQLYVNTQFLINKSTGVKADYSEFAKIIGEEGSEDSNTLIGGIEWLSEAWGWSEAEAAKKDAGALRTSISRMQVSRGGRNTAINTNLSTTLKGLEKLVGVAGDDVSESTIYARISETEKTLALFDESEGEIDKMLAEWNSSKNDAKSKTKSLEKKIVAVNKIPAASKILTANRGKDNDAAFIVW